jgi:two-component system phosphate regulon sensor histidine kinase PhoR
VRHSIRWRFAVPFALFSILTIIGLSFFLFGAFNQVYEDSVKNSLVGEARLILPEAAPLLTGSPDLQKIEALAHRYAAALKVRVTIIAADGVVLGESDTDPAQMENHSSRPEFQQALHGSEGYQIRYSATLRTNMLYAAVPVMDAGRAVAVVRLARPLTEVSASLAGIRTGVMWAALILSALVFLIAVLISNYTFQPIMALTEAARQYSQGSVPRITLPVSDNEIGRLSMAFDQMAARIQSQIEALESEQGKLRSVLEKMMDGVIVIDRDDKIQIINPAAERMFKVQSEGIIGQSLIKGLGQYQVVDLWRKCIATGAQQTTTIDINPGHIYLQVIAAPLGPVLPGSTLLLFQDLTQQRRLQTVRQDFVSNVSHELRTPLASLKALVETLQEGALEDPPAARRFLERMEIEIDTLTQMVRELLELSRIESGRVPLKLRPIPPIELLTLPFERMRVQAERAGISMTLDCPPDLPHVLADGERMEQVLVNLLHNAIKFTPPGGSIQVSAILGNGQVIFLVRDTGIGIAANDLPRIFERFFKADRARSGGGTGLGLSIARHIIEAHGEKIWVESTQGQGSTFFFTLPLA